MDRRLVGGVVAAAGIVLLVLCALADPIGIGDDDDFGWKQMVGVVIGAAAVVVGLGLFMRKGQESWL